MESQLSKRHYLISGVILSLISFIGVSPLRPARANPAVGFQLRLFPLAEVVGKPPAPGSDALKRDLAVLRWQQFSRDSELVGHAWSYLSRDIDRFQGAIGSDLKKTAPKIRSGVPQFVHLVGEIKNKLKDEIGRSRPFITHQDLQPCLPREYSKSYPSGHSTWYVTTSLLLADLLPERRERLLAVGYQGMAARVTCGMHYPSDVEAGQRLGNAAVQQILLSPQWQNFKLSVQSELKALIVSPAAGMPVVYD